MNNTQTIATPCPFYQDRLTAMRKLTSEHDFRDYAKVVKIESDCFVITDGFRLLKLSHTGYDIADQVINKEGYPSPVKFPNWRSIVHGDCKIMSEDATADFVKTMNNLVKGINTKGMESLVLNIKPSTGKIVISDQGLTGGINFGAGFLKYWKAFNYHTNDLCTIQVYSDQFLVVTVGNSQLITSLSK